MSSNDDAVEEQVPTYKEDRRSYEDRIELMM